MRPVHVLLVLVMLAGLLCLRWAVGGGPSDITTLVVDHSLVSTPISMAVSNETCFPTSREDGFAADRIANCLLKNFKLDRRSPADVMESLLNRPRRVARAWYSRGGCTESILRRSFRSTSTAVSLRVVPPKLLSVVPDNVSSWFFAESIQRVVASTQFLKEWEVLRTELRFPEFITAGEPELGRRYNLTASLSWRTADGFPLVLHFGDFAGEGPHECVFGAYSREIHNSSSFTVWDPYVAPLRGITLSSYRPTNFLKHAQDVFGTQCRATKFLGDVPAGTGDQALAHSVTKALRTLPAWESRKDTLYFRGSPTHRIRRAISEGATGAHLDIAVRKFYQLGKRETFEPFSDCYSSKMVLALRGMNAALRDRQLLLSGSALVRIMDIDKEPLQMPHDMLHPFVHYIPLMYRGPVGKTKAKQGPKQLVHLTGMGLNNVVATLLKDFGSKSFDVGPAGKLTVPPESILHAMGQNNLRVAAMIASEQFRDEVVRRVLWMYIAYALNPTM